MKKKCLALILSIAIMTGLFITPAVAINIEETGAATRIPENVAEIIASFFVRDFQSMPDTVWTSETEIANVVTMHDVDGSVSAYSCELETAGAETGYVVVSAYPDNEDIILEFSDTAAPLYDKFETHTEDSIVYTGTLNYFLAVDSDQLLTIDDMTIDRDEAPTPLADNFDEVSQSGIQPLAGGDYPISDPYTWAKYHYTGNYSAFEWKNAFESSCKFRTTDDFKTVMGTTYHNHCGPTAITNMIELVGNFRNYGTVTSQKPSAIFYTVALVGTTNGYYHNSEDRGTESEKTGDYIKEAFKAFGITVSITSSSPTYSNVKSAIDGYKPIYLGLKGHTYYGTHAVMGYAYTRIKNEFGTTKDFLKVADGWDHAGRFILLGAAGPSYIRAVSITELG